MFSTSFHGELEDLLETNDEVAEFVNVISEISKCRDPKDNFLLTLEVGGKAACLPNRDKDQFVLK